MILEKQFSVKLQDETFEMYYKYIQPDVPWYKYIFGIRYQAGGKLLLGKVGEEASKGVLSPPLPSPDPAIIAIRAFELGIEWLGRLEPDE